MDLSYSSRKSFRERNIDNNVIERWKDDKDDDDKVPGSEIRSWLDTAINRCGGKIGEFLLRALETDLKESEDRTPHIPDEYKNLFRSILTGKSYDAAMARVVLASRLWWLWALDGSWIEEHMMPILEWDKDGKRAEQAWHGYLFWGRWTQALLPVMMPYYKSCFPKQKEHFSETIRSMLSEHLASIALFGSIDPIKDGWLFEYLDKSEEEDRVRWSESIYRNLEHPSPQLIRKFWPWLEEYWQQRNQGKPVELSAKEKGVMLG